MFSFCYDGKVGGRKGCVVRLASLPVWSDLVNEAPLPSPQKYEI